MAEKITKVEKISFGERIKQSLSGAILGLFLFVGSFFVLWMNEGRVEWAKIAKTAIQVNPEAIEEKAEGKLISVTGELQSSETLGDPEYLKPGPYIKLVRQVEMYSWVEKTHIISEKKIGGEKVQTTTYSYIKEWTRNPPDSSKFYQPEGHENSPLWIQERIFFAKNAQVGVYAFSPEAIDLFPSQRITLSSENVILPPGARLSGNYIFIGRGTLSNPEIGDVRISFSGVPTGKTVTLFGKLENGKVVPYYYKGSQRFYRLLEGTREDAIAFLAREHKIKTWLLRGVGFLMMWLGLGLILNPLVTLLGFFPILEGVAGGLIMVILFVISLILTLATIIIAKIFHNLLALILVIFVLILGSGLWLKRKLLSADFSSKK